MKPHYRLTRAELVPVGAIIYTLNGKSAYRVVHKTPKVNAALNLLDSKGRDKSETGSGNLNNVAG